jgi:hypothetical protein
MNHRQSEKYNMYKKLVVFFANRLNAAVWAGFPRLVKEIEQFESLNQTLSNYMQQQQVDNIGITTVKNNAFLSMISETVSFAQLAYIWAQDENNETLKAIFDVHKTEFMSTSEIIALTKVKNIRDTLSIHIDSLTSVQLSPNDITILNTAISIYENSLGSVGSARSHKTVGTQALDDTMVPLDDSLSIIDYLLVNSYKKRNPDLVSEYLLNRNIDRLPTHHNGFSIHVVDAQTKEDLAGVTVTVMNSHYTSNLDGIAEIIKLYPGTVIATLEMVGYVTQNIKITIERGKIKYLEIEMIKS